MKNINWENLRLPDKSISLLSAYLEITGKPAHGKAGTFLLDVMIYRPIRSRQVAALAVAMAVALGEVPRP